MKVLIFCLLVLCDAKVLPNRDNAFEESNTWLNSFLGNATPNSSTATKPVTLQPTVSRDACETDGEEIGKCVNPSQCDEEKEEIDLTQLSVYREASCHYLKKCCPINQLRDKPKPINLPKTKSGCGWSNPGAHVFREKYSDSADYGEFPWMIAMINKSSEQRSWDQKDYLGGGSLIHPSVVMTAAHKIYKLSANQFKCRAGEWDTQTTNELFPHQERDVKKIIVHPEFLDKRSYNNIALIILDTPLNLTDMPHMGLACLGKQLPRTGTICYSMGWGRNFYNVEEYAVMLKKVPLPLVDKEKCEYSLRNTLLGSKYKLHNSQICAGGEKGIDTCTGDGGSPLVCEIESDDDSSRYAVYGMVSFGIGCGANNVPGVYANVPFVYDWVVETVAAEGLPTSTFTY